MVSMKKLFRKDTAAPVVSPADAYAAEYHREQDVLAEYTRQVFQAVWDGDKFPGSFGLTKAYDFIDYWTLRERSLQLFKENPYCIGIINRLLMNEIHTGLVADATPIASIVWPDLDEETRQQKAVDLGEQLTQIFNLYSNDYAVFDSRQQLTRGEFERQIRMEAMLCGDGIVVNRIDSVTGLPCWDWINGNCIRSPSNYNPRNGNTIKYGVEFDSNNRQVAYHVQTVVDGSLVSKRIPVKGERSGRQISWMVYGTDKLLEDARGIPILAAILYMLKELDRYRDAVQRKAVINSIMALYVKRPAGVSLGSRPSGGFSRINPAQFSGAGTGAELSSPAPSFHDIGGSMPGQIIDGLAPGEEIVSFNSNCPDSNYETFQTAITDTFAWMLNIPPEELRLMFSSNYSASEQAQNQWEQYLTYRVQKMAKDFSQICYNEFIIQAVLNGRLSIPGFLPAAFDADKWMQRDAWLNVAWSGLQRHSRDRVKDVAAAKEAIDNCLSTYDVECRRISGMSFRQIVQRRAKENQLLKQYGVTSAVDETNSGTPIEQLVTDSDNDSTPGRTSEE